jgi:uncharacterized membrane protein YeaQ/YmgE (transglycosylase-associated protein family)
MFSMIGHAIFGLIIGLIARWLMPGPNPHGVIMTSIVGMVGAWLGGVIGRGLGWYKEGQAAGWLMAIAGAVLVLAILRGI